MKIKTSELIGPALDWAVAKCEGLPLKLDPMDFRSEAPQAGWWVWFATPESMIVGYRPRRRSDHEGYSPSTDWAQGGPISEREGIAVWCSTTPEQGKWAAADDRWMSLDVESVEFLNLPDPWHGPTRLVAEMRCYVASKLGDEVDVPEELLK